MPLLPIAAFALVVTSVQPNTTPVAALASAGDIFTAVRPLRVGFRSSFSSPYFCSCSVPTLSTRPFPMQSASLRCSFTNRAGPCGSCLIAMSEIALDARASSPEPLAPPPPHEESSNARTGRTAALSAFVLVPLSSGDGGPGPGLPGGAGIPGPFLGPLDFPPSPRAADLSERVRSFITAEIEPVEPQYHRDVAALRES